MLDLQSHYKTPALTTIMMQGTPVNTSRVSKLFSKAALLELNIQMPKTVYQKRSKGCSLLILRFDSKTNTFIITFFSKERKQIKEWQYVQI